MKKEDRLARIIGSYLIDRCMGRAIDHERELNKRVLAWHTAEVEREIRESVAKTKARNKYPLDGSGRREVWFISCDDVLASFEGRIG